MQITIQQSFLALWGFVIDVGLQAWVGLLYDGAQSMLRKPSFD